MTTISISSLSDRELLERISRAAGDERSLTADLLSLIGECDARRLYLGEGCSSLFTYCTQLLRFSEHAAYHRIEGARAARRLPIILKLISEGAVTLTTVALLRPHLTSENHQGLLAAASHRTKREVEHQIASLAPMPETKILIRRLPAPASSLPLAAKSVAAGDDLSRPPVREDVSRPEATPSTTRLAAAGPQTRVAALAADRYLLRVTLAAETVERLRRAQALMGHSVPDGNPAVILDKALSVLVDHLERRKLARVQQPASSVFANAGVCKRVAPRSRSDTSSSLGQGRRAMCVRWGPRPMHRNRPPGIPSHHAVCARRPNERGEPCASMPEPQRLRVRAGVRSADGDTVRIHTASAPVCPFIYVRAFRCRDRICRMNPLAGARQE